MTLVLENSGKVPDIPVDFPYQDLVPKTETETTSFLRLYPEYDGRETVIAILDTGVDPLAKGLQTTTDGKRKIIDCIDTTGCGDVDTSTKVSPDEINFITGLTGRKLKIPESWNNPSNKYNIGIKNIFELYYPGTKRRVIEKRKQALWEEKQAKTIADIKRQLIDLESSFEALSLSQDKSNKESDKDASMSMLGCKTEEQMTLTNKKEDLMNQLLILDTIEKKFPDQGPVADVITWNDGSGEGVEEGEGAVSGSRRSGWCVCVDTSFTGDLESCQVLRPYKEHYDVGRISDECACNYSVCVYGDQGEVTVLVTTRSHHGTHVAAIAAAHRPDNPDLNGVAPGAQIVSINIGDSRVHAMETGTALTRAMDYCNRNNIPIANYSFGEPSAFNGVGRIMNAISRSVRDHDLCFVSSFGNNGPALRTGGAPGGTCDGVFGVSAYISPAMRKAQYSLHNVNGVSSQHYSWSSRGPCTDGFLGVSCCAPGGAITSVSQTDHNGEELLNGTSMSSPNVAGSLALLVSALKHLDIPYTPQSIYRSVQNTASKMPNHCHFSSGPGVLQVLKAFEHAKKVNGDHCLTNISFKLTSSKGTKRGILLHKESDFIKEAKPYVTVEPYLNNRKWTSDQKCDFSMTLSLVTTASWVDVPSMLYLTNSSRGFYASIDTKSLTPGAAHFSEILGYDQRNIEYGPVFRFPVSILKPLETQNGNPAKYVFNDLKMYPGAVFRRFLRPPEGASYATVKLNSVSSQSKLCLHCLQIKDCSAYTNHSTKKHFILEEEGSRSFSFEVVPGLLFEVCLAQMTAWSWESVVSIDISFHGLEISNSSFAIHHFGAPYRIDIRSRLENVNVDPNSSLTTVVTPLRPTEAKITPLHPQRDVFVRGPLPDFETLAGVPQPDSGSSTTRDEVIYGLELTYSYSHPVKDKEAYPECPLICDKLYENLLDSQMWVVYDGNKQVMGYGDFKTESYSCLLSKGDYTIKLWLRSWECDVLENLNALQLTVSRKLPTPVNLSFFNNSNLNKAAAFRSTSLPKGDTTVMFAAPISEDKLPKPYVPGSFLTGKIGFIGDEPGKSCNTYQLTYTLGPSSSGGKKDKLQFKEKDKEKSFVDAMRDAKLAYLQKSSDLCEEDAVKMFEELLGEFPKDLQIYCAFVNYMSTGVDRQKKYRENIIKWCEKGLSLIDQKELLAYYGCEKSSRQDLFALSVVSSRASQDEDMSSVDVKTVVSSESEETDVTLSSDRSSAASGSDKKGSGASIKWKDVEKLRDQVIQLLQNQISALMTDSSESDPKVEHLWKHLKTFCDPLAPDSKTVLAVNKYCKHHKLYGPLAVKWYREFEDNGKKASMKNLIEAFYLLGWSHVVDRLENSTLLVRYPPNYAPF